MTGFLTMIKCNLKLIMRNRAAIILIFLIPLASTLIFKIPLSGDTEDDEMTKMNIMIFDNSESEMSHQLISSLKNNKCFNIKVYDKGKISISEAKKKSELEVNKSVINTYIYIPSSFYDDIKNGNCNNIIRFYTIGSDERINMLKESINLSVQSYVTFAKVSKGDKLEFDKLIKKSSDNHMKSETKSISDEAILNSIQKNQSNNFGYFIAIITFTLMFSSNFIASIFIEEKDNRVLKRIGLTRCSMACYSIAKIAIALVVLMIQSIMVAIGIKLFVSTDVGLSAFYIIIIIFFMGIVFSMLSIASACILGELNVVNYVSFFLATISTLLSGLYFPIDKTPDWMKKVSLIMPQRWAILSSQGIMTNSYKVLYIFIAIMISYTILMICTSLLSLKNRVIEN